MNSHTAWQLKIFEKTLKKKEKLALIRSIIPPLSTQRCLDLGCAKGTISYFLRAGGGHWFHEDLDFSNVAATRELVGPFAAVIPSSCIPHRDSTFDLILSLDIIEHISDDQRFLFEMARVLRSNGTLILSTPATGPVFLLNRLKKRLGLTPDQYGHVVEGYTIEQLDLMLKKAGFQVDYKSTYSRFFTELIELMINFIFVKCLRNDVQQKRDGHVSPGSAADVSKYKKQFALYSAIYPIVWLISRFDRLLFWQKGYATLIVARKVKQSPNS